MISLLISAIRAASPLLFAGMGETFAQKSGVMNIGIEGIMMVGAFVGFTASYYTGNPFIGLLAGMLAGGLVSLIQALVAITLGGDQVISGIAIWIACTGLVDFLYRYTFGIFQMPPRSATFETMDIPILSKIPILGEVLFQHNFLVYLAFILIPITAFILTKTTFSLKIRAVGENPKAADVLGINVHAIRYLCVVFGGIMAGMGGAFMTLSYLDVFDAQLVAGRGFIAFTLVYFAGWNIYRLLVAGLFFGVIDALQMQFQALGVSVPPQALLMLPYVMIIVVLISLHKRKTTREPAALCVPYMRS